MNSAVWESAESIGTAIDHSNGPVNSGDGPQFNLFGPGRLRSAPEPDLVTAARRGWLAKRFVRPPNFAGLRAAMDDAHHGRTVLLGGRPGDGIRSSAVMLLHERGDPESRFRNLETEETSSSDNAILNPEEIRHGDRMVLDLSQTEPEQFERIQRRLEPYRAVVVAKDGHLAVVLNENQIDWLDGDFRHLVKHPGRANPMEVLRAHLHVDGIPFDPADLQDKDLREWASAAPLRSIGELVRLLGVARERADGRGTFSTWLSSALPGVQQSNIRVAARLKDHMSAWDRAVLLSAALLEGSPVDAAYSAAEKLFTSLGSPVDETPVLERQGFVDELRELKVGIDSERNVHFDDLAFDTAVRNYFWDHSPGLRDHLRVWVRACMRFQVLRPEDRDNVAKRYAEQCLRTHQVDDLCTEAEAWATAHLHSPSVIALLHGWHDRRHGWRVRRRIYDWTRNSEIPPAFGQALTTVCGNAIRSAQPDQALVRLHHLARHRRTAIATSATAVLLEHAADEALLRQLVGRLSAPHGVGQRSADRMLFGRLADRRLLLRHDASAWLIDEPDVRTAAIECWRQLMGATRAGEWGGIVHTWLAEAATAETRHSPIRVLVRAAQDTQSQGALYRTVREWALRADDPHLRSAYLQTATEAIAMIDQAQGLTTTPRRPATEGEAPC